MYKYFVFVVISLSLFTGIQEKKIDFDYVTSQFKENLDSIYRVEYNIHRIDSFASQNVYWNNTGTALIEKNEMDSLFGISFFSENSVDTDHEYLYDNGIGLKISRALNSYKQEHPFQIIGSPGGQMVVQEIFKLDSIYKTRELIEKENEYVLTFTFEEDTIYNMTEKVKVIELRKSDFFPIKITSSYNVLGNTTLTRVTLSNIKINDEVSNSIAEIKKSLSEFDVIEPEVKQQTKILNMQLPEIMLPNLLNEEEHIEVQAGKLTLIDFWEVWCGPCVKSLTEIESINQKYGDQLQVVGIVSQYKENAAKMIDNKKITFTNLIGNKSFLDRFGVNRFPRYFLVDKEGVVRKEYTGFSDNIERDIMMMLE